MQEQPVKGCRSTLSDVQRQPRHLHHSPRSLHHSPRLLPTQPKKNAAEATDGKGHIDISAFSDSHDNVNIGISNDGQPIPPDVAARIFVPFFTTKPAGSGIGLSVSRQIMRAMGRMIALARNDSSGVTFHLTFL